MRTFTTLYEKVIEYCYFLPAGILWNLSAKDLLKEKLKTILPRLTEKVLIPLSISESTKAEMIKEDKGIPSNSPSETEILHNTLGCLR